MTEMEPHHCLSVSEGMCQRMNHVLFTGAEQQDKRQRTETDEQKAPPEHEEELLFCVCDCRLEYITQRSCGVSFVDIQNHQDAKAMCFQMALVDQGGEDLQPPDHFCGHPLDLLQQVHVIPVLGTPELEAALQVEAHLLPTLLWMQPRAWMVSGLPVHMAGSTRISPDCHDFSNINFKYMESGLTTASVKILNGHEPDVLL
ncbi:hypothetical protein WISP_52725 [Willisornis vidua]|uniref:Uncharacterized protein n=1 Tax=Willisornis vidua TaxID=1566151 RepID=A0ABQ9DJE4_9PASS|nr:hypothetical protein WISP_52725 [Willisornis vidua]